MPTAIERVVDNPMFNTHAGDYWYYGVTADDMRLAADCIAFVDDAEIAYEAKRRRGDGAYLFTIGERRTALAARIKEAEHD